MSTLWPVIALFFLGLSIFLALECLSARRKLIQVARAATQVMAPKADTNGHVPEFDWKLADDLQSEGRSPDVRAARQAIRKGQAHGRK